MLDFLTIYPRQVSKGVFEIYHDFLAQDTEDLMIRGKDFYAIWIEERGLWSTKESDAVKLIDKELTKYVKEHPEYKGCMLSLSTITHSGDQKRTPSRRSRRTGWGRNQRSSRKYASPRLAGG